jgi:hypothetical protein
MKNYTLIFTQEQLQILNDALVELKFKTAAPLIQHVNAQIQKQFDDAKGDSPTGQTTPKDEFSGD